MPDNESELQHPDRRCLFHAEEQTGIESETTNEYDDVQAVIEETKAEEYPSDKYHRGVLATILENGGPASYEEIAERLGVSRNNEVSSAATTLESYKIVEKEKRDGQTVVDLNVDGLQEIREAAQRRRRTSELMEEL